MVFRVNRGLYQFSGDSDLGIVGYQIILCF